MLIQSAATGILPTSTGLLSAAQRFGVLPMPNLAWTPEVERETAHL